MTLGWWMGQARARFAKGPVQKSLPKDQPQQKPLPNDQPQQSRSQRSRFQKPSKERLGRKKFVKGYLSAFWLQLFTTSFYCYLFFHVFSMCDCDRLSVWPAPTTIPALMLLGPNAPCDVWLNDCFDFRQWAFFVLRRFGDLLGVSEVQHRLKQARKFYSFCSGIECFRHAWTFIIAASIEMWGVDPDAQQPFSVWASSFVVLRCMMLVIQCCKVEKDKGCKALIMNWFDDDGHCIFGNILDMCANQIPENRLMKVSEVKVAKTSNCVRHNKECPIDLDVEKGIGILGLPCVLFSKMLSIYNKVFHLNKHILNRSLHASMPRQGWERKRVSKTIRRLRVMWQEPSSWQPCQSMCMKMCRSSTRPGNMSKHRMTHVPFWI